MQYFTVYKITNKLNGKIYIGCHKTNDLNDGYMGSGNLLKRAQSKYGIENFTKDYIHIFDNSNDMFNAESRLVNEDFINRDDTYNIKEGGKGGFEYINNSGLNLYGKNGTSGYGLENLNRKGFIGSREEMSEKLKEYYMTHDGTFKGRAHTDETKQRIGKANSKHQTGKGNSQYDTMWIHNLELKQSKKISKHDPIPRGWLKGRKLNFI
jgi:hypothetical protein